MRLLVPCVIAGCSFSPPAAPGDDSPDANGPDVTVTDPDDADPEATCLGPASGPWRICFEAPLQDAIVLPATLDTTEGSAAPCLAEQPADWIAGGQPPACFVTGETISGATVEVTGDRPLVLLAAVSIQVDALDASSRGGRTGPGADQDCPRFERAPSNGGNGGGGGAGGSFGTQGGQGGRGDEEGRGGEPAAMVASDLLRGGCPGQRGGNDGGTVGRGGGAVYLAAGQSITALLIDASGRGASGADDRSGGSGGGSGGMIALHAPALAVATVLANGGGGASGGTDDATNDGDDPDPLQPLAPAAGGTAAAGGAGGPGFAQGSDAGEGDNGGENQGGGGGGGGAGVIRASTTTGGLASPATLALP